MPSSIIPPLPTLHHWGQVLVQHITSYCSVLSWQPYPLPRSYDPANRSSALGSFFFAPLSGVIKHTWAFFVSTSAAIVASIFVLAGSALWTVLIKRAEDINTWTVRPAEVPLGIEVTNGIGLYLVWAAFACLATSIIPYAIRSVPLCHLIPRP